MARGEGEVTDFDYQVGDIGPGGSPVVAAIARSRSPQQAASEEASARTALAARAQGLGEAEFTIREARANRAQQLSEAEFAARDQQANAHLELAKTAGALDQANNYYNLATKMSQMQDETHKRLDAADFLTGVQNIRHDDPQYEDKVAGLAAKYPLAGHDQTVNDILNTKHAARQQYLQGTTSGVLPGEEHTLKAMEQGLIRPSDFEYQQGQVRPATLNPDGTLNHLVVAKIAAARAGAAAGLPQKAEERSITQARELVSVLGKKDPDNRTAAENELYDIATSRLLKHENAQRGYYDNQQDYTAAYNAAQPGTVLHYQGKAYTKPKPTP